MTTGEQDAATPDARARAAVRMEPLATLPVFFKLDARRAVMAGGDRAAAWKAELLAAAGAHVDVYAADPCDEMVQLAAAPPAGAITLVYRAWKTEDLANAAIAIGAIDNETEAGLFRDTAHRHGVPVNVIDKPPFCDFQFGTIVARSPLVIGISTDGGAPVFAQALRARIEALLPQGFRAWAQAAKDWRPAIQAKSLDFRRRRRFWEAFTDMAIDEPDRTPSSADKATCLAASLEVSPASRGTITLVGCGPGTPDSLTFQAARTLQSADLVVYDADVPDSVVALARREAAKMPGDALSDRNTASMLNERAAEGQHVAWLGTGNPGSCSRWFSRARHFDLARDHLHRIPGLSLCPRCIERCDGALRSSCDQQ